MDVYICFCCGYPIIFRGYPPQVYHLGTGWPCWNLRQAGLCQPGLFPNLKIPSTTPKSDCEKLLDEAKELYEEYVSSSDASPILEFIKELLEADHGDCIRDFLGHIADRGGKPGNALVCRAVASPVWQGFVCRLRIEQLYDDYLHREDETEDATLVLKFVEVQLKSNRRDCVSELLAYLDKQEDERANQLLGEVRRFISD